MNGRGQLVELPPDLAEKMQSAWRAVCRKAADHGEHSSLLAEGMVDKDFGIVMKKDKGRVILERVDQASAMPKGEVIKPQGRILTLTAKEAVACELAKALVPDAAGLANSLGMKQEGIAAGAAGEQPATFYDRLFAKIDALGLDGDSLTELARKKAEQEVSSLFKTEWGKVKGTRVSWNLVLMEAKPPKGSTFQVTARARTGKKKEVTISANVRLAFKEAVASISPGQPITLTGTLSKIDGRAGTRFGSYMMIQMDDCVVGKEDQPSVSGKAIASTTAPADPEAEAKRRLNLSESYRTNGMHAQAAKALRSIIDDFPKTASAKRAAEDLAEVEKEMKEKSAKDSSK